MVNTFLRKNLSSLILKHTSPIVWKSAISFSFSLSTLTETQIGSAPKVFDILLHRYNFPSELASQVASVLTHLKNPENADSVLSFFKECGFSNTQLAKIIRQCPRFLVASVENTFRPKIKMFQDYGFSSIDISKMVSSNPKILHSNLKNSIIPSLSVLKDLLVSNDEVIKAIRVSPRLLTVDLKNTALPNVEFLKSCGIPMERIRMILTSYPSCIKVKPEVMRKCADKAKEMGLNASSKSFIYAIATIAKMSNETWELKLQAFRNLGFSDNDISTMFGKGPTAFYVSTEKLNKVVGLLLGTGKYSIASIVNYPKSVGYSIDKRYIPRLNNLGILERRKLLKEWPSLGELCRLKDDEFSSRFIGPYLDEVRAERR